MEYSFEFDGEEIKKQSKVLFQVAAIPSLLALGYAFPQHSIFNNIVYSIIWLSFVVLTVVWIMISLIPETLQNTKVSVSRKHKQLVLFSRVVLISVCAYLFYTNHHVMATVCLFNVIMGVFLSKQMEKFKKG